ncbi:MAG: hypothetical protein LBT66_03645 [Methanobrevibacter sp.]|jgi:hypothetical protein|nr:hypothetical protein [Candidatus Methanovirga meridionalis]
MIISIEKDCNREIRKLNKYKDCEHEYKINMNLLAGKLKINLFKIIFREKRRKKENMERSV